MSKVDFIVFSDVQVEDWKRFSTNHSRLLHGLLAKQRVARAAEKHKCPILFCGDFFDNPSQLNNLVITSTFKNYDRYLSKHLVYGISGNHDQSESNTITHKSPSHLDLYDYAFDNFHLLDGRYEDTPDNKYRIHGIPYLKGNLGFVEMVEEAKKNLLKGKKNILLIHTDFHNIKYDKKRTSGTVENLPRKLNRLFKGFDMVFSGHIHMPSMIRKNILMVGATNHQRVSDIGVDMGYWKYYDDGKLKFVKLDLPEFKIGKDKNDGNFYLPKPKKIKELNLSKSSSFVGTDIDQLAKNYLKANNIKSKRKLKYLSKYLKQST